MKPLLKGGLIGFIIGIISLLGSMNHYGALGILDFINFPFILLWRSLFNLSWTTYMSIYIGIIDLLIFTGIALLLGYLHTKNKKTFKISLAIAIVAYIILFVIAFLSFMGSFV